MSEQASRIEFLRQQQSDLSVWLASWPAEWSRRHAYKKKTRLNLETINRILREHAVNLIAGAY